MKVTCTTKQQNSTICSYKKLPRNFFFTTITTQFAIVFLFSINFIYILHRLCRADMVYASVLFRLDLCGAGGLSWFLEGSATEKITYELQNLDLAFTKIKTRHKAIWKRKDLAYTQYTLHLTAKQNHLEHAKVHGAKVLDSLHLDNEDCYSVGRI